MLRRIPRPLAVLLALGALQAVAWSVAVAPLQGPDEPAHFNATQRLVEQGDLAPRGEYADRPSNEIALLGSEANLGPTTGNLAAKPATFERDEQRWKDADAALGDEGAEPATDPPQGSPPFRGANRNPPLYYVYEAAPYLVGSGAYVDDRLQLMRLANVPLYLAAILFTWLLAGELLGRRPFAQALATALLTLQAQLAFLAGMVNPDVLLVAVYAAFAYVAVRLVKRGLTVPGAVWLAAATVAAIGTHGRAAALVPAALAALALSYRRSSVPARTARVVGVTALAAVALGAAVYALAGGGLPGGTEEEGVGAPFKLREFASYLWQFYLPKLGFMDPAIGPDYGFRQAYVETFYGTFGSLEVRFPDWTYDLLKLATLAAIVAFVVALVVRRRETLLAHWDVALVLALMALTLIVGLHVAAYRTLLADRSDALIVGRHLLPLLPLLAIAVAWLVSLTPRRVAPYAGAVLLAAAVTLQLAGLGITLTRFYA